MLLRVRDASVNVSSISAGKLKNMWKSWNHCYSVESPLLRSNFQTAEPFRYCDFKTTLIFHSHLSNNPPLVLPSTSWKVTDGEILANI